MSLLCWPTRFSKGRERLRELCFPLEARSQYVQGGKNQSLPRPSVPLPTGASSVRPGGVRWWESSRSLPATPERIALFSLKNFLHLPALRSGLRQLSFQRVAPPTRRLRLEGPLQILRALLELIEGPCNLTDRHLLLSPLQSARSLTGYPVVKRTRSPARTPNSGSRRSTHPRDMRASTSTILPRAISTSLTSMILPDGTSRRTPVR